MMFPGCHESTRVRDVRSRAPVCVCVCDCVFVCLGLSDYKCFNLWGLDPGKGYVVGYQCVGSARLRPHCCGRFPFQSFLIVAVIFNNRVMYQTHLNVI